MPNSIRTPSEGLTETSRRIAKAVDDENWQRFRLHLKGKTTSEKLGWLRLYLIDESLNMEDDREVINLRVDNYLKALARGGQIAPLRVDYIEALKDEKLVIKR